MLTDIEKQVLAGLVRAAIRKTVRLREKGPDKYGEDFDPTRNNQRIELLEGIYRKLGKDPDNITVAVHDGG